MRRSVSCVLGGGRLREFHPAMAGKKQRGPGGPRHSRPGGRRYNFLPGRMEIPAETERKKRIEFDLSHMQHATVPLILVLGVWRLPSRSSVSVG
jgi:hypothetical protein